MLDLEQSISVVVDPAGRYAYVAMGSGVAQFLIGPGGALAELVPPIVSTMAQIPQSVTIDASGKYVYVANQGSDSITQFTIGAGGTLSSPTLTSGAIGSQPYSITTAVSIQ